jgi:hypothetical protein
MLPAERERVRRQSVLRIGLLICLILVFLDGGVQRRGDSTGFTRGSATSSLNNAKPDLPAPYLLQLNELLSKVRGYNTTTFPRNCTGLYNGEWRRASIDAKNTAVKPNSEVLGHLLLQLRSVALTDVPVMDFVYGVVKLYKGGETGSDLVYPLQGVFVASTGEIKLLSSSDISGHLYLELPSPSTSSQIERSLGWDEGGSNIAEIRHFNTPAVSGNTAENVVVLRTENGGSESSHVIDVKGVAGLRQVNSQVSVTSTSTTSTSIAASITHSTDVDGRGVRLHMVQFDGNPGPLPNLFSGAVGNPTVYLRNTTFRMGTDANTALGYMVPLGESLLPQSFRNLQRSVSLKSNSLGGAMGYLRGSGSGEPTGSCKFVLHMSEAPDAREDRKRQYDGSDFVKNNSNRPSSSQHRSRLLVPESTGNISSFIVDHDAPSRSATEGDGTEGVGSSLQGDEFADESRAMAAGSFASSLKGQFVGDCGAHFNMSALSLKAQFSNVERKASNYSLIATTICFLEIFLLVIQLKFSQSQAAASKVSVLCMSLQVCCVITFISLMSR